MRVLLISLLAALLLISAMPALAQDSAIVKWSSNTSKISEGRYEITLNGVVKKDWHIYAKADAIDGLSGIVVTLKDSSVTKTEEQILSPMVSYADPLFENRNKAVAQNQVTLKIALASKSKIPAVLKLTIAYETAFKDNFIPEEQTLEVNFEGGSLAKRTRILIPSINLLSPKTNCDVASSSNVTETKSKGLLPYFSLDF